MSEYTSLLGSLLRQFQHYGSIFGYIVLTNWWIYSTSMLWILIALFNIISLDLYLISLIACLCTTHTYVVFTTRSARARAVSGYKNSHGSRMVNFYILVPPRSIRVVCVLYVEGISTGKQSICQFTTEPTLFSMCSCSSLSRSLLSIAVRWLNDMLKYS